MYSDFKSHMMEQIRLYQYPDSIFLFHAEYILSLQRNNLWLQLECSLYMICQRIHITCSNDSLETNVKSTTWLFSF